MAANKNDILEMHLDDLDFSKESSDFSNDLLNSFIDKALESSQTQSKEE